MKIKNVSNFYGGLSLLDSSNVDDNQLVVAKNVYYDSNHRIRTRKGIQVWSYVPDAAISINTCDATTNWSVAGDASTLTTESSNHNRGTGCNKFTLSAYSTGSATLTNSTLGGVSISGKKGYVAFWLKTPSGTNTKLTSIKFRLGTDSSNYYEWTLPTVTESTWKFVNLAYSSATTMGTVTDTNINYCRLEFVTQSGYAGYAGVLVDDIRSYSANYTKPVPTIYSYKNDINSISYTFAHSGASIYLYNTTESKWEQIDSTVNEFESGSTTQRVRFDMCAYKTNVYMAAGNNNYRYWDGKTMTTTGTQYRYVRVINNVGFIAGNDTNPHYIYYTAVAPSDLTTFGSNLKVGDSDDGRINALFSVGSLVLAFKDQKIYYIDVLGSSDQCLPIDSQNGGYSQRAIANIANGILYFNETGIDYLKQKAAQVGASALESESYVKQIQEFFDSISATSYNSNCGIYNPQLNNYYLTIDTDADDSPDTTIVYSSLVSNLATQQSGQIKTAWTEYTYPELYCYTRYVNTDKSIKYLASSANSGIIYSIEDGYSDYGNYISYEVKTKEFDFDDISLGKEVVAIDLIGVKGIGFNMSVDVIVDGEVESSADITDDQMSIGETSGSVGIDPLGTATLVGLTTDEDSKLTYPYLARIYLHATGRKVQIKVYSEGTDHIWTIDKIKIAYNDMSFDEFPEINKI